MRNYWRLTRDQHRPLKFLASRLLMRMGLSRFFLIHRPEFKLRFYPTHVSAKLWLEPNYHGDFDEELFLRRYLKPGDTVVDVGANVGFTTLVAASRVGASGKVIAVEPHPRLFSYLAGNVRLNDVHVQLHNVAVGERPGLTYLTDEDDECINAVTDDAGSLPVTMESLDRILAGVDSISLLKVDVEGYELFALTGAAGVLGGVECVYVESFEDNFQRFGYASSDLVEFLHARGFQVLRQTSPDSLEPFDASHRSKQCENLIAVRDVPSLVERTGHRATLANGRGVTPAEIAQEAASRPARTEARPQAP